FHLVHGTHAHHERGALVRSYLAATTAERWPGLHVNDLAWLRSGPVILVNGRWLPPATGPTGVDAAEPCLGVVRGEVAYGVLPPEYLADCSPLTVDACLEEWKASLPARSAGGWIARYLWELVDHNGDEVALDAWLTDPERPRRTTDLPALVGPADRLLIDPS